MEEETRTQVNRKMLTVAIIIALFALYLGYIDGRYDKNASNKAETTIQN